MLRKSTFYRFVGSCILALWTICIPVGDALACKVLIVMSYDEDAWLSQEMKTGIDDVLAESCEITYFYLNPRNTLEHGEENAAKAYELFQELVSIHKVRASLMGGTQNVIFSCFNGDMPSYFL